MTEMIQQSAMRIAKPTNKQKKGRGFDPNTGHGSLLKIRQFHLAPICLSILSCKCVPMLLGRYLRWTSVLSRRVSTTAL